MKELFFTEEIEEPPGSAVYNRPESEARTYAGRHMNSDNAISQLNRNFYPAPKFIIGKSTRFFIKKHFPGIKDSHWNDWSWQLKNRFRKPESLEKIINLTDAERNAFKDKGKIPISITPYYASILDPNNPEQPLRKSVIPTCSEGLILPEEVPDPLKEENHSPVPGLIHRYPDRVLFLATNFCSVYCRYCTRSRLIGKNTFCNHSLTNWIKAVEYIEKNKEIRDVLISGGDPLTMPDERLDWLLSKLRRIPHVELLRIGTKVPSVLPQRITRHLLKILKKYHPLWVSIHFIHPDEITPEVGRACGLLADAGIPLGSQTVLLKGINDDLPTMKQLMHRLIKIRVKPYYLYQCDPIPGSSHFRTPVSTGIDLIHGLRGHTTGYAVPQYVIDAPGGGGKIPVNPDYVLGYDRNHLLLKNYEGRIFAYPDLITHNC